MSIKVVDFVLASAVATNGTFAVNYPTGFTKGDFTLGYRHKFMALQTLFQAPKHFTTSFGATSVTVTYLGTTTLPANTAGKFEFDLAGANFGESDNVIAGKNTYRKANIIEVNFGSPLTVSTTALMSAATSTELPNATTTTYTFAANGAASPLDGANTTGVLDVPRNLVTTVTHGSSIVATTVKYTGKRLGQTVIETHTITATGTSKTATGAKIFDSVTSIAITSATDSTANTVSTGFGQIFGFDFPVTDANQILAELVNGTNIAQFRDKIILPFAFTATEAGAGTSRRIAVPCTGTILRVRATAEVSDTGGGTLNVAVADAETTYIGAAVAGGSPMFSASTAAGSVRSATVTAGDASAAVTAGQQIVITPGTNLSQGVFSGHIEIQPTLASGLRGTFVAAVTGTTPSASTGDVFGTYSPETAPDGSTSFQVWIRTTENTSPGTPQFTG